MSHTVTAKLNSAARQFQNSAGTTFFVSLGEKNYDHKTKQNVWTNYDAALFAKDAQTQFYNDALVEGAIVSVSGTGIILDASDPQYKPKLVIQDAKLGFVHSPQGAPQQPAQGGYQAPAQQGGYQQQQAPAKGGFHQPPQAQGGYQQQMPANTNNGQFQQQQPAPQGYQQPQQSQQINPQQAQGGFDDSDIPF